MTGPLLMQLKTLQSEQVESRGPARAHDSGQGLDKLLVPHGHPVAQLPAVHLDPNCAEAAARQGLQFCCLGEGQRTCRPYHFMLKSKEERKFLGAGMGL